MKKIEKKKSVFLLAVNQLVYIILLFLVLYFVFYFYKSQLTILMAQLFPCLLPVSLWSILRLKLKIRSHLAEKSQLGSYHWSRICSFPSKFSVSVSPLQWRGKSESAGWCQQWYRHLTVMVRSGCLPFCREEPCGQQKALQSTLCLCRWQPKNRKKKKDKVGWLNSFKLCLKCVCPALWDRTIQEFVKLLQWIHEIFLYIIWNQLEDLRVWEEIFEFLWL